MSDLIFRQDAFDAVDGVPYNELRYSSWYHSQLENVPSAEFGIMSALEKRIKELLLAGEGEKAKGFGEAMTIVADKLLPKEAKT